MGTQENNSLEEEEKLSTMSETFLHIALHHPYEAILGR